MKDRLPPQDQDAERSVLGAILIDNDALIEVLPILKAEHFYWPAHARIFEAMSDLFSKREPVDIVTVAQMLQSRDQLDAVGGRTFLSGLASSTPTAIYAEAYAKIVAEKAVFRGLIAAGGKIAGIGYSEPEQIELAIDQAQQELFRAAEGHGKVAFSSIRPLLHTAMERIEYVMAHRGEVAGIPSGLKDLDELTTGFRGSDLILIAARPSVGKTSLAMNIAEHATMRHHFRVGVFSLEMSKDQLTDRLISSVARVDSRSLRSGYISENEELPRILDAMGQLNEVSLFIEDTPGITVTQARTIAQRMQMEVGLDLVIVDYLQLMAAGKMAKDAGRVEEVSIIARGLKHMARELRIPVIALSQLSRNPESRDTPEPRLSDLRESGSLEQDADLVIFLWRPKPGKDDHPDPEGEVIKVSVAKHRNGPTGTFELYFKKRITRFGDYAPADDWRAGH